MEPGVKDLTIYQGDDFPFTFRIRSKDDEGNPGPAINLTGATGKAEIRTARNTTGSPLATFTVTVDPDQNANTGVVHLDLAAAVTTALAPTLASPYVWDVEITLGGKKRTYLTGNVTVKPEVTK